jgi:glycosyltransferase involved in cell wall biosynthesis
MMFSYVPFKRSADGIKALTIAKQQFPDLEAVLFGVSPRAPSLPPWITYVSDPSQQYLVENILNRSSIVLSPSLAEGFGLPAAEGAACGCAVVSTDSGGVRDFIIPGESGLLSAPGDPEALARNLCRLLGDDNLRVQLAELGRLSVQRLDWERSADLLESFLRRAMENENHIHSPVEVMHSPQIQAPRMEMN